MTKTPHKLPKRSRKRNRKLHRSNHIIKGGIVSVYEHVFYKPNWQKDAFTNTIQWTTLVKLKDTCLYATSIPDQDTNKCLATLMFYMHVKDIKRIISLQGCDVSEPPTRNRPPMKNCEGYIRDGDGYTMNGETYLTDKHYESRMWKAIKSMNPETEYNNIIEFQNHKIEDYTAGSLRTWFELLNYNYYFEWEKTIIHCLAGFGRTGSILLLVYMNTYYQNNQSEISKLSSEFFYYSSSSELYTGLQQELSEAIELDIDDADVNAPRMPPENGEVNRVIKNFDKNKIVDEVFNIKDYTHANLLITRMNYIRICLGTKFKQDTIFLFQLLLTPIDLKKRIHMTTPETVLSDSVSREQSQLIAITPETIFSSEGREPVQINLSDIETISKQVDNPYGIKV